MYNILICDDERDIVSALKIYLADPQYRLFEAYTGKEALAAVAANDIQLILMDIMYIIGIVLFLLMLYLMFGI